MGTDYYHEITKVLQGQVAGFEGIPRERLDWGPSSAVLAMYGATSGHERDEIIRAMGQIIENTAEPPFVIAQVLHIAACLDIAQIEPSVEKLRITAIASQEPVRSALQTYRSFRQLKNPSQR
jgi:hypothetical protein